MTSLAATVDLAQDQQAGLIHLLAALFNKVLLAYKHPIGLVLLRDRQKGAVTTETAGPAAWTMCRGPFPQHSAPFSSTAKASHVAENKRPLPLAVSLPFPRGRWERQTHTRDGCGEPRTDTCGVWGWGWGWGEGKAGL